MLPHFNIYIIKLSVPNKVLYLLKGCGVWLFY